VVLLYPLTGFSIETVASGTIAPVASVTVPETVPEFPADCAHRLEMHKEKQIAIAAKMTRREDVFINNPLEF
jgi:hypothetical protein